MLLGLAASAHLCLGEALLLPVNIWELLLPHFYARPRAACWEMLTGLSMKQTTGKALKPARKWQVEETKVGKVGFTWVYVKGCMDLGSKQG